MKLPSVSQHHVHYNICLQDEEDSSDDDDDTAELLAELNKIKKERAREKEKQVL